MSNSNFQDELRNLEKSIQEDDEWTALKSLHRAKLVEFLKVSETLIANIDKIKCLKCGKRKLELTGQLDRCRLWEMICKQMLLFCHALLL